MVNQSARLTKILDYVLENGSIQVEDIETLLGVSPATARRDLDRLASQQMVTGFVGSGG